MVTLKEIGSYKEYGKCLSISNGEIEAYVSLDLGPRIVKFGYVNGQNFMNDERSKFAFKTDDEFEKLFGKGRGWESMGGHRVWLAPESWPETYTPDDKPVEYKATENGAIFVYAEDTEIGVQKELEIKMDSADANMQVVMRIKNITKEDKEFAIWSLSVCSPDGTLILPMNTVNTGLLPNRIVSVWPYSDMSDSRVYWGKKYITIKQDTNAKGPFKTGIDLNCGTAYYVKGDDVFYKKYNTNHPNGKYVDGGCSFETYTDDVMLEFETLGELKVVAPGETSEHTENWMLCKKPCEVDFRNDESVEAFLAKI